MAKEYVVISKEELLTEAQIYDYCFYNKGQITTIGEFVDSIIKNAPKLYLSIPEDEKKTEERWSL